MLSLLELYYGRLRAELERRGGTVEKYIGDAIVTHFGVPVAHEDDPERAVRAALAILETVEALNAEDPIRQIQVRIGIATGEVIVTHGAKAEEGKGIAWGDVLNTAARIESAAPVDGILVGEETYRATAHAIEYARARADRREGQGASRCPSGRRSASRRTPVRGRVARRAARRPRRRARRAARALGRRAGAGQAGARDAPRRPGHRQEPAPAPSSPSRAGGAEVLWGRCLSYGEGITYWPVEEILEGAAGHPEERRRRDRVGEGRRAARRGSAPTIPTSCGRSPPRSRT